MKKYLLILICLIIMNHFMVFADNNAIDKLYEDKNYTYTSNLYFNNINDMFLSKNRICVILWKIKDDLIEGCDSRLIIYDQTKRSKSLIEIPGAVFALGDNKNGELCSISQKAEEWKIVFYNLEGNKLYETSHRFMKKPKEDYHMIPIPLMLQDKSVVFYSRYQYEERNRILGFFLSLISGGHGWKPKIGDYIEINKELINQNKRRIPFIELQDSTYRKNIFNYDELICDTKFFDIKKIENKSSEYTTEKILIINHGVTFYRKKDKYFLIKDNIIYSNGLQQLKKIATLPGIFDSNKNLLNSGNNQFSDINIDKDNNIHFLYHNSFLQDSKFPIINYYFYNSKLKKWNFEEIHLNEELYIEKINLLIDTKLYISIWSAINKKYLLLAR